MQHILHTVAKIYECKDTTLYRQSKLPANPYKPIIRSISIDLLQKQIAPARVSQKGD